MKVIKGDRIAYFDIDGTLIHWGNVDGAKTVKVKYGPLGASHEVTVVEENVRALMIHRSRDHTIVVWSAGGYKWAEAAVKALGLTKFVDVVMCKPSWIYDDLDPGEFMPKRMWGVKDPGKQSKENDEYVKNIERSNEEISKWSKSKLENALQAFSETMPKKLDDDNS